MGKVMMTFIIESFPCCMVVVKKYPLAPLGDDAPERTRDPIAPADYISEKYRRYFHQVHARLDAGTAHGLTAEFFEIANVPEN